MRQSTLIRLVPPSKLSLEQSSDIIGSEELVEMRDPPLQRRRFCA